MSFLRSVSQLARGRDAALKRALLNNLSECVKDIQYHSQFEENFTSVLGCGDTTSALCAALEAILLHGLKDTLLRKARNALADPQRRPQPDFWPLVLVLSHRQSVEHIAALPHVTTQIGQCRAWLRAALNDCLLSSYLAALARNSSAVKPFYSRSAFACDAEALELAQRLIEGLESCVQFDVPINSSLLNDWPESVLMLAGVWLPPLRVAPVSAGFDIASSLRDDGTPASAPTAPILSRVPGASIDRMLALDEDEALNFILSERSNAATYETIPVSLPQSPPRSPPLINPCDEDINTDRSEKGPTQFSYESGNEVGGRTSWSKTPDERSHPPTPSRSLSPSPSPSSRQRTPDVDSLSSLAGADDTPDLRDMMRDIHADLRMDSVRTDHTGGGIVGQRQVATPEPPDDPVLDQLGYELVPASSSSFPPSEWNQLIAKLCTLSRELGLDSQNYKCADCQDPLGVGTSRARVCAFTGEYYCGECTDPDVFLIPARIVHNWDFRRYAVSRRAARFLLEAQHRPLLDVRRLNPRAYDGVADLRALRDLRVQLNLLRAYVATCREREKAAGELRRMLWPREYLYEAVHTYAPADLAQVPSGTLAGLLQRTVSFAREHVLGCWLCSQKGFICEVCRAQDPLYPFDTSCVYRCERCCGVFHESCLQAHQPCPKCARLSARTQRSS